MKYSRSQNLTSKHRAVTKNLQIARTFQKLWIKKQHNFSKNKLFTVVFCLFTCTNQCTKMNFSIKNFFSKCDHILIKLRIYSHLINKPLSENFIFCVVNFIGFATEFCCEFFFKPNCQSLVQFTKINT